MNCAVFFFVISLCISFVYGQVISPGICPRVPTVNPFDIRRYVGTWYEFERFFLRRQAGTTCTSKIYQINNDQTVRNLESSIVIRTGIPRILEGVGAVVDPSEPARAIVRFFDNEPIDPNGNYLIIKTDYVNFAVVYSCTQIGLFKSETAFIRFRRPITPSRRFLRRIYNFLRSYGINPRNFIRTNFRGCLEISAYKRLDQGTIPFLH